MRIEADLDLCQGHGVCEMEASGIFVAHKDQVEVIDATPDESRRAEVETAVRYCPTQALKIIEDNK